MKLHERLESEWRTLESGEEQESLRRTLVDLGLSEKVCIAIDSAQGREIHFEVPSDADVAGVPNVYGVRVLVRNQIDGGKRRRFLVLRCGAPDSYRVFSLFAADVLQQVASASNTVEKALEVLSAWREMFRRVVLESESRLRGVFGELHELAFLALRSPKAVQAWSGPENKPQDFKRGLVALEVKSSKWLPTSVEVHGLRQLWASPLETLVLAVKQVTTDNAGQTIAELASELVACGVDVTALWDKLEQAELPKNRMLERPGPRFTVRNTRYYLVTDVSPVLTPDTLKGDSLPAAVSGLCYQLDLGALTSCPSDVVEQLHRKLAG